MGLFDSKKKVEEERQKILTAARSEADGILAEANDFYNEKKEEITQSFNTIEKRTKALDLKQAEVEERITEFTKKSELLKQDMEKYQLKFEELVEKEKKLSTAEDILKDREKALEEQSEMLDQKVQILEKQEQDLIAKEAELASKSVADPPEMIEIPVTSGTTDSDDKAIHVDSNDSETSMDMLQPTMDNIDKIPPKEINLPPMNKIHQAPNAMVGKVYSIELSQLDIESNIVVIDILDLEDFGLSYSSESETISGTPTKDGECVFPIRYDIEGGAGKTTLENREIRMFINPDPRSLWKNLDPDDSEPFGKAHEDFATLDFENLKIYGASQRGRSHAHEGTFRDDDFLVEVINNDFLLLVVADGAGSAKYSREGSRIACEKVKETIADKLDLTRATFSEKIKQFHSDPDSKEFERTLKETLYDYFGKSIVEARNGITTAAEANDAQLKDFSTTLLFSLVTRIDDKYFVASYSVGDGIVANFKSDDQVELFTTPDGGEFAGQTRFLTMSDIVEATDIWKRISMHFVDDFKGLFLMTDGVSDPYFETDANLQKPEYWAKLYNEVYESSNKESDLVERGFLDWLNFWSPGNHDDRTIIFIKKDN